MGERIKDLVYDFSDIIISLIIITLIFGVVSWKISDSMAYNSFTDEAGSAAVADKDQTNTNDNANADTTVSTGTTDQTTTTDNAQTGGKPAASDTTTNTQTNAGTNAGTNTNTTTPATTTNTTTPATNTTTPATTVTTPPAGADFKVEIPAGSSGLAIAKILKEKSIISDTKMFITRVDQLKMGSKLKAGSFTIKSGSTLDEVIYTLTGKK